MKNLIFLFLFCGFSLMGNAGGLMVVLPENHQNPGNIHSGHLPNPDLFPLIAKSCQIDTDISDLSAHTRVKQVFYNPTNRRLEAYFLFPIPEGATISEFAMTINGKRTEGEVLDAAKAKKIYEDIVRRAKDPALLEFYNRKLFRVRVFPIEPRSEQIIELAYKETLSKEDGFVRYDFPLNTEKYAAKPLEELSFRINIKSTKQIKNVFCPTHRTEINQNGKFEATLGYENSNVQSAKDLEVFYQAGDGKPGITMLDFRKSGEEGYFMLNIAPGLYQGEQIIEKDITFVLDASGSMAGDKLEQAKKALEFCIHNLNQGDRFNLIRFSTEASSLFEKPVLASKQNIEKAEDYISSIRAIGGTNIDEALTMALNEESSTQRPAFVVFLTDGKPTIGETQEEKLLEKLIKKNTRNTRIFTFGIGYNLNTHLLDKITESSKAYRSYVTEDEDIEVKVSAFYTKIASPVLSDVEISFDRSVSVNDMYPKALPDLFNGSSLTLMGRYNGHGNATVTLRGKVNGKSTSFNYNINFSKENNAHDYIAPLWAARCVGHLLDQIRLHGSSQELIDEVVKLSKKHGIITPYTSYLIVEDEQNLVQNRQLRPEDQLIRGRLSDQPAPLIQEEMAESFSSMAKKESRTSVRASEEIQQLNNAENADQTKIGSGRLQYTDSEGLSQNLAGQIKNVQGRAFYNNNNEWIDATIQESGNINWERIKFNSDRYFDLIKNNPESVAYLNLGKNVRFNMGSRWIEIFE